MLSDLPRRVLLPAVAAAAVAAGCGGGELSKSEYEQQLQETYADIRQAFRGTARTGSLEDLAEAVEDVQAELRSAADELDDADPPRAAEEPNEELVQALRGYADDLDIVVDAGRAGNAQRVRAFNRSIRDNRWVAQMQEVFEQLTAKGFDLGEIPRD